MSVIRRWADVNEQRMKYLKFLGRPPDDTELEASIDFIEKDNNNLANLIQILICTGEFRNVK